MRLSRPSAALVLGAMAGSLAAVAFLPTSVPLILIIMNDEETRSAEITQLAVNAVQSSLRRGEPISSLDKLRVRSLWVEETAQAAPLQLGVLLPADLVQPVCEHPKGTDIVPTERSVLWAVTCMEEPGLPRIIAGMPLDPAAKARRVLALVLLLGLLVGIITALGILRLLRPLSEISGALARVGAGERGVRMAQTGLAELDELVDRMNAAARSVEDREDAILGRIEVVQEMARIVAHEIRNPLQSLELLTSLIASEEDPHERLQIASSIHVEVRTLEQVVHRLLRESATRGSLRLKVTTQPVAPLVEQVIALRRPQANSHAVRLTMGPISWSPVPFDQALLKRSIENLVLNALQAVPDGVGEVRVSVLEEAEWIVIVVDDNGPGVPPEIADHVFEANVTSKEGGTGLGLALVKGVVEAHSGYIRYGTSPLGGARFEARIPRASELLSVDAPVAANAAPVRG